MSYSIERVRKEFTTICNKAGVQVTSPIELNGRLTRTLGRVCMIKTNNVVKNEKVEFSKQLLETTTDSTIESVIKHEAAHYIVTARTHEAHGHDSLFKAVCAEIGTDNDTPKTTVERTVAEDKIYKYFVKCNTCNQIVGKYHRKSRNLQNLSSCYCKTCGQHNLVLIQNY